MTCQVKVSQPATWSNVNTDPWCKNGRNQIIKSDLTEIKVRVRGGVSAHWVVFFQSQVLNIHFAKNKGINSILMLAGIPLV